MQILKDSQDRIAEAITLEHGKSLIDAKGDVFRGYEVVEHASSFTSLA
jgi:malonate-semialdehyde dehydrogenase (acetylating) / methylmalonate-semialdehyde dehydrogenase